ncbi:hypothetical protein HDU81_009982 [Chytriomyces hyalinus]|nr:hypothetical protein HDU81_009982 [Chytriomyces hyalinus]
MHSPHSVHPAHTTDTPYTAIHLPDNTSKALPVELETDEPTIPSPESSSSHSETSIANQSPNTFSTLTIPFHYPSDQLEGDHGGKFFKEHMDSSLEGLLPAFVFHARMKALNAQLGALKPRQLSIPWKIQVTHFKKNGDELVFLPEYTPRFSCTFLVSDRRAAQGIEVVENVSVDGGEASNAGLEDMLHSEGNAWSEFSVVAQKTTTASRPPSYTSFHM